MIPHAVKEAKEKKGRGRFSVVAFLAWAAGACFLVPCSKDGLASLFGLGEWLAWSGAVAVTLGGSAGAAIANRRWLTGWAVALLGYSLAVSSDAVALVERLRATNDAGASVAVAEVEALEARLPAIVATVEAAEERHRAAVADAFDESRTGKGSAYAALTAKAESLADQVAVARADHSHLLESIGKARSHAAEVKAGAHWLGSVSWAPWALCGFAAGFELLVVILAGQIWTPGKEVLPDVGESSERRAKLLCKESTVDSLQSSEVNEAARPGPGLVLAAKTKGKKADRRRGAAGRSRPEILAPYHARKGAAPRASPASA